MSASTPRPTTPNPCPPWCTKGAGHPYEEADTIARLSEQGYDYSPSLDGDHRFHSRKIYDLSAEGSVTVEILQLEQVDNDQAVTHTGEPTISLYGQVNELDASQSTALSVALAEAATLLASIRAEIAR